METNNTEPNRERLAKTQDAQGKGGSETDSTGQQAEGTNKPEKDKKPRKAKAERLKEMLEDQAKLAKDIAALQATIAGATSKDALRLLEMIGDACFKALAGKDQIDLCKLFEQVLLKQLGAKDQAWYGIHSKALLAQGLPIRPNKSGDRGRPFLYRDLHRW